MKKHINDYNVVKIEDKHEVKTLKELLIDESVDALLYYDDKKEVVIVIKLNGDTVQPINDNELKIFKQTSRLITLQMSNLLD